MFKKQRPQPQMYAPGRPHIAPYESDGTSIAIIIAIFIIVGTMALCILSASGSREPQNIVGGGMVLCMLFAVPIVVIAKAIAADLQPSGQQILQKQQKQYEQAEKALRQYAADQVNIAPHAITGPNSKTLAVMGAPIIGTLAWCFESWTTIPEPELAKHAIVIGGSGTGKTVTLMRIAYIAASIYGYRVYFLDGKGDRDTAASFLATMREAGRKPRMFPRQQYDGWRGDGTAILNRLMAIVDFSEPFYEDACMDALTQVCLNDPKGPPRSSRELLARLAAMHASQPANRTLEGVMLRYRSFFGALRDSLDAGFSFEDCTAAYLLLDGLSLKKQAESLGRFYIEDFANYAVSRKHPGKDLLIIDEYSAIAMKSDVANLVERLRSYGCSTILSSQSYAGLGQSQEAERILDAANTTILHRCAAPEPFIARAGRREKMQETYQFGTDVETRLAAPGRAQWQEEYNLHPDYARRLEIGEALIISHGQFIDTLVTPAPRPNAAMLQSIREWIDQPAKTPRQPDATQPNHPPELL